jgi:hypothetical protein
MDREKIPESGRREAGEEVIVAMALTALNMRLKELKLS